VAEKTKYRYKAPKFQKADAKKLAAAIGCSGAHQDADGKWLPCATEEEMQRLSTEAEPAKKPVGFYDKKEGKPKRKKRGKRKRYVNDGWENLRQRAPLGFDSLPDGGIVSGNNPPIPSAGHTVTSFGGGIIPGITNGYIAPAGSGMKAANSPKSMVGPEYVRDNDPDVFVDPDSARARSRQLGCIGISRRISKTGRAVWMPCTNMSDYSRVSGSTSLGRRGQRREMENTVRTIVSRELKKNKK
jgi:hypothetical protein